VSECVCECICYHSPALLLVTFLIGQQRQDSNSFLPCGNETKDFRSMLFLLPVVMVTGLYPCILFRPRESVVSVSSEEGEVEGEEEGPGPSTQGERRREAPTREKKKRQRSHVSCST